LLKDILIKLNLTELENKLEWAFGFVITAVNDIAYIKKPDKPKYLIIREVPLIVYLIALSYRNKTTLEQKEDHYTGLYKLNVLNDKLSETAFNTSSVKIGIAEKTYLHEVHKGEFVEKINKIISNQAHKHKSDTVTQQSLLLLNYLRQEKWKNDDNCIDIQTIIPRKTITEFMKDRKCYLPINVIGNLCMIEPQEHKRKAEESLINYMTRDEDSKDDTESIYKKYMYMGSNIDYDNVIEQLEISEKIYFDFIKLRAQNMRDIIIDTYESYFTKEEKNADEENDDDNDNDNKKEKKVKRNQRKMNQRKRNQKK